MDDDWKRYLELHKVDGFENPVYAITPSSLSITVYRQQIRALNLAHALYKELEAKPANNSLLKVAIIGGGFAGVTLAAALLRLGKFEVHLFEQRPELCHLQAGCETRSLHPTIYDWPDPESTRRDARLPLLNWSAGTAGDVARSVLKQFDVITEGAAERYSQYLGASARLVRKSLHWDNATPPRSINSLPQDPRWLGRGGTYQFDYVIFAVGFGTEAGVPDGTTPSYWRNDRFGQARPGTRSERSESILISGTGDGALIDLIRTCIRGFKHDALIEDLFSDLPELVQALDELRRSTGAAHKYLLPRVRELSKICGLEQSILNFTERLRIRRREDTHVILNGTASSLYHSLTLEGRSFLNVCLACFLYDLGCFSYVGGRLTVGSERGVVKIANYGTLKFDSVILRHGTKQKAILRAAGLQPKHIRLLAKKQANILSQFNGCLWPPGWWSDPTYSGASLFTWPERVPRAELLAGTVLLQSLCEGIRRLSSIGSCKYRLNLHRVINYASRDNLRCYQQLATYAGNATDRLDGKAGRVFDAAQNKLPGAVGVSISTRKCFVSQLPNDPALVPEWHALWDRLISTPTNHELGPHHKMEVDKVSTVLTVPILNHISGAESSVAYVLYVDVEHDALGNRVDLGELLSLAKGFANGFGVSIHDLAQLRLDDGPLFAEELAMPPKSNNASPPASEYDWILDSHPHLVSLSDPEVAPCTFKFPTHVELRTPH